MNTGSLQAPKETYKEVSTTDQLEDLLLGRETFYTLLGDTIENSEQLVSLRQMSPDQISPYCWCGTEGELEQRKRDGCLMKK